ncbi:MAG: hypothetical protein GY757_11590 [bacterium]|nr:hypothetical protein [bacterium]
MRTINLSNEKKRDAEVAMETNKAPKKVFHVLEDGSAHNNIKILKSTLDVDLGKLLESHSPEELSEVLVKDDPEIDFEHTGMLLQGTSRVYLKKDKQVCYSVKLMESKKGPDGQETENGPFAPKPANVSSEFPLRWTGKLVPKKKAIKTFVFSRKYQIRHVNGITFDFLFDMAKTLQEKESLLLLGAGKTGKEPLIFMEGGAPYRAFLEGRVEGETYCLLLHLTNLELKEIGK